MASAKLRDYITLHLTGTYGLAHLLDNVVAKGHYSLSQFSDHFSEGIGTYIQPYRRWTALHVFAEFVLDLLLREELDRVAELRYVPEGSCASGWCPSVPASTMITDLMTSHSLEPDESWVAELRGWRKRPCGQCPLEEGDGPDFDIIWSELAIDPVYELLLQLLAEEVFFVLFANRTFLYHFNDFMSIWIESAWTEDPSYRDLLRLGSATPVLKRREPPQWAKDAVFFRDRGLCSECGKSVGAYESPIPKANYDYIVPLARGGLNDVTNLQLLCADCNNGKRAHRKQPSRTYQRWFPATGNNAERQVLSLEKVVLSLSQSPAEHPLDDDN